MVSIFRQMAESAARIALASRLLGLCLFGRIFAAEFRNKEREPKCGADREVLVAATDPGGSPVRIHRLRLLHIPHPTGCEEQLTHVQR
jgi:hypothetical protein